MLNLTTERREAPSSRLSVRYMAWMLAAVGATGTLPVHATETGFYVSADASRARASMVDSGDGKRSAFAAGAQVGYRWPVAESLAIGVEGGYANLGKINEHSRDTSTVEYMGSGVTSTWDERRYARSWALTLGLNLQWHPTDRWFVTARAGQAKYHSYAQIKTHDDYVIFGNGPDQSGTDVYKTNVGHGSTGAYYGAGVGYDITTRWSVAVTYDHYNPEFTSFSGYKERHDVELLGARVAYQF